MLAANSILQNRYRVIRELGHGGMGTVYEALDQRINCLVALKETVTSNSNESRRAFEREASLLGNLRHSALPKVMDYFSEGAGDFLVMEFIPGYDLAELLELQAGPFAQVQVLRWADELLNVLEYLHGQQPPILHRDIKPANLKLTKQGEIFLLDFGLAKGSFGQMPTLATSRSVRGYTAVYASLEQIHGHGTDARSDLYSVGATLYHLITGVTPVDAPARYHAAEDEKGDPLPTVQKLNSLVSPAVAGVIHQAMAVSRKHRPLSAAEMRTLLRKAAPGDQAAAEEEYRRAEARLRELAAGRETVRDGVSGDAAGELRTSDASFPTQDAALRDEGNRETRAEGRVESKRDLPTTVAPSTPALQVGQTSNQSGEARAGATTMPGRPPEQMTTGRDSAAFQTGQPAATKSVGSKRLLVMAAGILVVLLVGGIFIWSRRGTTIHDPPVSATPEAATSPAKPLVAAPPPESGPPGMVYVPGGTFTMGREIGDDAERPPHQVTLKAFFIDTYEVTNEDYAKFVKATNHRAPSSWKKGSFPPDAAHKPVTGVTWDDANDYARWAGKRLPTEEEWEFAARGSDGRLYPWGNDWQASANANGAEQSTADVGGYKGASPFGAYDMVGNAWEWTASNFRPYPGRGLPSSQPLGEPKVIRGGCYESTKDYATTTYRAGWPARSANTYDETGFRCARDMAR